MRDNACWHGCSHCRKISRKVALLDTDVSNVTDCYCFDFSRIYLESWIRANLGSCWTMKQLSNHGHSWEDQECKEKVIRRRINEVSNFSIDIEILFSSISLLSSSLISPQHGHRRAEPGNSKVQSSVRSQQQLTPTCMSTEKDQQTVSVQHNQIRD